jgi:hypothetical protein
MGVLRVYFNITLMWQNWFLETRLWGSMHGGGTVTSVVQENPQQKFWSLLSFYV